MFITKHQHEEDLKRIVWCLKLTWDRGLILNINRELYKIYSYPDLDFYGMCGSENRINPAYVKSRTGEVVIFSDCPIL